MLQIADPMWHEVHLRVVLDFFFENRLSGGGENFEMTIPECSKKTSGGGDGKDLKLQTRRKKNAYELKLYS